jgi:hypothetical protein
MTRAARVRTFQNAVSARDHCDWIHTNHRTTYQQDLAGDIRVATARINPSSHGYMTGPASAGHDFIIDSLSLMREFRDSQNPKHEV